MKVSWNYEKDFDLCDENNLKITKIEQFHPPQTVIVKTRKTLLNILRLDPVSKYNMRACYILCHAIQSAIPIEIIKQFSLPDLNCFDLSKHAPTKYIIASSKSKKKMFVAINAPSPSSSTGFPQPENGEAIKSSKKIAFKNLLMITF